MTSGRRDLRGTHWHGLAKDLAVLLKSEKEEAKRAPALQRPTPPFEGGAQFECEVLSESIARILRILSYVQGLKPDATCSARSQFEP